MSRESFDIQSMYRSVRKFSELGTGREGKKILVGDSEDARTGEIFFVGNVFQNWPSWRTIKIKTDAGIKTFDTSAGTIDGQPVYIFLWNELTADLWFQAVERKKLFDWLKTANTQDQIGMSELIADETGAKNLVCNIPGVLAWVDWRRVQIETRKLNSAALRRLNSLFTNDRSGSDHETVSTRSEPSGGVFANSGTAVDAPAENVRKM